MSLNIDAKPFVPKPSMLSPKAKEFIPDSVKQENEFFDMLERKFISENKFIFNAEEEPKMILKCKNTPFQKVSGARISIKKFEGSLDEIKEVKEVKLWSDVI